MVIKSTSINLAEVAFCTLENEKKIHVIHVAYQFSYAN